MGATSTGKLVPSSLIESSKEKEFEIGGGMRKSTERNISELE
jgi:hypothetical protein